VISEIKSPSSNIRTVELSETTTETAPVRLEIEAAAQELEELDPDHPAIPALYERVRESRARAYLH